MIFSSGEQQILITLSPSYKTLTLARQQERRARKKAESWRNTRPASAESLLDFADLARERIQKLVY